MKVRLQSIAAARLAEQRASRSGALAEAQDGPGAMSLSSRRASCSAVSPRWSRRRGLTSCATTVPWSCRRRGQSFCGSVVVDDEVLARVALRQALAPRAGTTSCS